MLRQVTQVRRGKRLGIRFSKRSFTKETIMRNARTPLAVGIALAVAVPATVLVTNLLERRRPRAGGAPPTPRVHTWSPSPVPPEHPHALT
jgi:hypothetical protein